MSVTLDISERQLKFGVFKLALSLSMLLALVGFVFSLIAGEGQSVAVNALLVAVAFGFLANGLLAVLKIIDWFEARKRRHG